MRIQAWALTFMLGLLGAQSMEAKAKSDSELGDTSGAASSTLETEAPKDKRQVGNKDTQIYPNHRSDGNVGATGGGRAAASDDPEDAQETIYGTKPNQFIIRPIAPHQHQQHEGHQEPQLRNYAASNARPHAAQLLEQSQEVQHFVYLQDIMRHHQPKALLSGGQGKNVATPSKKLTSDNATPVEEAEQRYAVAIQAQPRPYASPYQLPLPVQAPQHHHQLQQQQQPYQVIPEEQFLKLLEEELQARSYHESQLRQQQQQHQQQQQQQHQQHQHQQQHQQSQQKTAATHKVLQQAEPSLGLGSYRVAPEQNLVPAKYLQYSRGGPKYLPHAPPPTAQSNSQQEEDEAELVQEQQRSQLQPTHQTHHHLRQPHHQHPPQLLNSLPPQIAYYQPQISYKTLPNHPLAKSSLESEIEKLLAANKPSPLEFVDNTNEPTLVSHQHQRASQNLPTAAAPTTHPGLRQPKSYVTNTTPNSLLDANNQPFIPSLFKFSNFQQPTPIYPTQLPQHLDETKKLGPVVYPSAPTPSSLTQPTQYYYQETQPTAKPKHYRAKNYSHKLPTPLPTKSYEKSALLYDYDRQQPPSNFYPSPPDPIKQSLRTAPHPTPTAAPTDYPQYVLPPSPSPSQSSIYVSQGTGIATPSRASPTQHKLRTVDEVKQLNLPPPNGKPLTQAEFQALVDAGYPVKAVPVPVPVPYEQYVKDHPEYRNHPPVDYAHLMRLATRQLSGHQRSFASSEPSVKIVSSPSEPQQTATAIGGGSVTYLQPIEGLQKRRPRDEQDTAVAGTKGKKEAQE